MALKVAEDVLIDEHYSCPQPSARIWGVLDSTRSTNWSWHVSKQWVTMFEPTHSCVRLLAKPIGTAGSGLTHEVHSGISVIAPGRCVMWRFIGRLLRLQFCQTHSARGLGNKKTVVWNPLELHRTVLCLLHEPADHWRGFCISNAYRNILVAGKHPRRRGSYS